MSKSVTVIGLDPGSRFTGYGIIREESGNVELVAAGVVKTPVKEDMPIRLGVIYSEIAKLIIMHKPEEAAVENVFVAKNPASALKLGQARGAAIAACAVADLSVASYEPTKVKKNIVGVGRAPKDQVAFMVAHSLGVKKPDWSEDTSDALAVALCHLNERRFKKLAGLK
ncbi:MAG: crossover junction endodeoxyribonuclease RuvC [Desulfovibrio sp.]